MLILLLFVCLFGSSRSIGAMAVAVCSTVFKEVN